MYITMGKIGSPYGITGELVLHHYANSIQQLLKYERWWIKKTNQDHWNLLKDEQVFRVGQDKIVIKIPQVDTREVAQSYVNAQIGVLREDFPKLEDEYYWIDLIGLVVVNHQGQRLGEVDHLFDTPANDVMVVKSSDDQQILIPFVDVYIKNVDFDNKMIQVYWCDDY